MVTSPRSIIVVEDDPFPRALQCILDPATPRARFDAFSDFFAHELPDFAGWCERLRARIGGLYPSEVRLVADEAGLLAGLPGAQVVVVEGLAIGPREIEAAGGALRIVQKYGTVTSRIDFAACAAAGIRVLAVRRRANVATAEHGFALLLALARKIHETAGLLTVEQLQAAGYAPTRFDRDHTPNANWARITGVRTLLDQQLGIVGLGEVGREMALRAAAFEMRVVYTQRRRLAASEEARYQVRYCALDELLGESDCVSLHLPGGAATRGIIGRRELAMIKPGALLVNVSQPQIVDRAGAKLGETRRLRARSTIRRAGTTRRPHAQISQRHRDPAPRRFIPLQRAERLRGAAAQHRLCAGILSGQLGEILRLSIFSPERFEEAGFFQPVEVPPVDEILRRDLFCSGVGLGGLVEDRLKGFHFKLQPRFKDLRFLRRRRNRGSFGR